MKTKNIFKIAMLAILTFALNSCVEDNDYSTPTIEITDPGLTVTNSISSVRDLYTGSVVNFSNIGDGNLIIEGYVVSSDESGNIYKTISIQDKPENPTAAIQLAVDATDTYTFYEIGRKVYVKLNGLGMNENNGVLEIGQLDGTNVERIASTDYKNVIVRSTEVATIVPKVMESISDLDDDSVGMLIQLNDMQVVTKNQTFADAVNQYSRNVDFKSCADDATIIMRNSGFATFAGQSIPEGKGSIISVLGKYISDFQLYIRDTEDLSLTGNRCDPVPLNCGNSTITNGQVIYEEDFSNVTDLASAGWENINTSGGSRVFGIRSFSGNKYAQASAYNSGENPMQVWLISPEINLDNTTQEELTFDTKTGYNNGAALTVFVSTDYSGDVRNATWYSLDDATLADGPSSGYQSDFTNSGKINLSCLSGNVRIAFRYLGGDGAITTTFQVDNVKVVAL